MSDDDLRDRVDQLRQQVALLGRMIGETIPGGTSLVPTTPSPLQSGHEVRRVVMDQPGDDRVLGGIEQEVIIDPQTRQRILQTTLHHTMSLDGRVVRDHASVYQCGSCHRGPLVEPKFCYLCGIPLCSYDTKTSYREHKISCEQHR